jgi:ABC-type Fe3+-citrate transport system substrate-binding protein
MKMKTKLLIFLLSALVVLVACSEMKTHPMDMSQAVQSASTQADHEALAKHYDEVADEMQLKVDEHKKLLADYHAKSYKYGRQGPIFEQHCQMLINAYESAVTANRGMAEAHRAMAAQ